MPEVPKVKPSESFLVNTTSDRVYLNLSTDSPQVFLKIFKIRLRNGNHCLETYDKTNDKSERITFIRQPNSLD